MNSVDHFLRRLTFRHQSPAYHRILRPLSYVELAYQRHEEGKEYFDDRRNDERLFHSLLEPSNPSESFLYATIVGFHKMPAPFDYPGFTYYFKIDPEKIIHCLFYIVDRDQPFNAPKVGIAGLTESLALWIKHRSEFRRHYDSILGYIEPRIEVVTQETFKWGKMIPQEEDRTARRI